MFAESTPRTVSPVVSSSKLFISLTLFVFATLVCQVASFPDLRRTNWQDPRQPLLSRREGRDCSLRLNESEMKGILSCVFYYRSFSFHLSTLVTYSSLTPRAFNVLSSYSLFMILRLYSWVLANESHIIVLHSFSSLRPSSLQAVHPLDESDSVCFGPRFRTCQGCEAL